MTEDFFAQVRLVLPSIELTEEECEAMMRCYANIYKGSNIFKF